MCCKINIYFLEVMKCRIEQKLEVLDKFIKSVSSKEIPGGLDFMKAMVKRIKKMCLNSKSVHGLYHVQQKRE